jgi:ribonuclease BN (tRNA processing enzyme)
MTSHVVVSNGKAYVLDCGLGVTNQFARTGIPFTAVRSIFITHHHPDHNIEYGPFLLLGWVQGVPSSLRAFGPPPLKQMTEDFLRAYKATIDFWVEDLKVKPLVSPDVKEVSAPGAVMQDENVKIAAAIVQHPPVRPALAYRFDFQDRSIAFSGDTAPIEAVARLGMRLSPGGKGVFPMGNAISASTGLGVKRSLHRTCVALRQHATGESDTWPWIQDAA